MKNILLILSSLLLINCTNKSTTKNNSIIGKEFKNFNEIKQLENYSKVSDTTVYENNIEAKYGILHLKNESNNLVVFKSILRDSVQNLTFRILDTLVISNSKNSEFITIGYCQIDRNNDENLISIVEKTDSLMIQQIKHVWKVNTDSKKIERVKNLSKMNCFNEFMVE